MAAGSRVHEYTSMEPSIPLKGGRIIPYHSLFGDIEFHNVGFEYPTRPDQKILNNFNLRIPAGQMVRHSEELEKKQIGSVLLCCSSVCFSKILCISYMV